MPTTVTSPQISAAIIATLTGGAAPALVSSNVQHTAAEQPVVGSSSGQVNKTYSAAFAVTTGTPISIDLTAAVDPLGTAQNFTQVHAILLENLSVTAGQDMAIFGGTNGLLATASLALAYAGTTPGWTLYNFGTTGITVDATHKIITIAVAAGTAVAGKITVVGK